MEESRSREHSWGTLRSGWNARPSLPPSLESPRRPRSTVSPTIVALILVAFSLWTPDATSAGPRVPDEVGEVLAASIPQRLWVAHRKVGIVEYDLATFAAIDTVSAPSDVLSRPDRLSVNAHGQILYQDGGNVWFWHDGAATAWSFGRFETEGDSAGVPTRIQSTHWLALSADGDRLWWFEQRFEWTFHAYAGERAQRVEYRVWSTDLAGALADTVLSLAQEWCSCPTGACCDSCMEWLPWVRQDTVGRSLLLTEFREGIFGPVYGYTDAYRETSGSWRHEATLEIAVLLDVTEDASVAIVADYDAGCCGWINESSDEMFLVQDGVSSPLYDEWTRFRNQRYDTSIYVGNAQLSPDRSAVAYTLDSRGRPDRPVWGATSDAADSLRIAGICAALPAVEVQRLDDETRSPTHVSDGALIGWISDTEVLVLREGRLAVFDGNGRLRRDSQVSATQRQAVFLR